MPLSLPEEVDQAAQVAAICPFNFPGMIPFWFVPYAIAIGNIGINIGVAAPMAFFPFSGWKESFFGDLHGRAMDAVEFYTQKKIMVERWPREWTRKF